MTPAVVIHLPSSAVSLDQLETGFRRFADEDDVFSVEFIDGALIYVQAADTHQSTTNPKSAPTLSQSVENYVKNHSARLLFSAPSARVPVLPEGPYFVAQGNFHQAWRLYEDELDAFVSSSVPAASGEKYA